MGDQPNLPYGQEEIKREETSIDRIKRIAKMQEK